MRKWHLLSALVFFASLSTALAQTAVSGLIRDAKTGDPLSGVSIRVKGHKGGTTTDAAGRFSISASTGEVLEITSIGFAKQEVTVTGGTVEVGLAATMQSLGELVYVGSRGAP